MAEDADRSSKIKSLVAAAKKVTGGGGDEAGATEESGGAVGRVKAVLSKATSTVTGLVKKEDEVAIPPAAEKKPTEHASKMKKAVEEARKGQTES